MTFNSYARENITPNNYLYNGKEEQKELGLGWLDYGARMYQPELGRFFTKDRFAEKYYSMSPYQYTAGNPVRYIDVNGDSIWVYVTNAVANADGTTSLETCQYYYGADSNGQQGFIDPTTGELYSGGNEFVAEVSGALDLLMSADVGQALVSDLASNGNHVQIVQSGSGNSAAEDGSFVRWNPDNNGAVGNERPSFVGLGHELAHVQDSWNGTLNSDTWFTYTTPSGGTAAVPKSEIYATFVENKICAEHCLPLRSSYAFDATGKATGGKILFKGTRQSRYFDVNGNPNSGYKPINTKKQTPFTH